MANLKSSRIVLSPVHTQLEQELLAKIEAVLAGQLSAEDAADWAVQKLYVDNVVALGRTLAASGLRCLVMVKFSGDPMTSALHEMRSALKGEKEYAVEVTELSREEIERRWPGSLASDEEMVRQWPPYAKYLRQDP